MQYLSRDYTINLNVFRSDFQDCSDFLLQEITVSGGRAFLCVMDGLVDSLQLAKAVTVPLQHCVLEEDDGDARLDALRQTVIAAPEMNTANTFDDCYFFLMSGFAVLVTEDCATALAVGVQGWNSRMTEEPSNESNVKGAKECFVESLNDNKALLRKRLKTPRLKFRQLQLGTAMQTPVVLAYLEGTADSRTVQMTEERLKSFSLPTVQDYGCLEPYLNVGVYSLFSRVGNTERPDVFASKLLEGRIGVMVEGTPFVLYTPYLFTDNFSSLDDYDNPPFYASFIRLLKYFSFAISVLLPALYVAIGAFHQEVIPTALLYIIASSEATTPFSLMTEAILIHLLYEIMREGGLRLPKSIGHAVSIIGAIVIGEAMVSAGLIGEPMLVVVALTALASYVVYPLYETVAVIRLGLIVIAGMTGIYGLSLAVIALTVNICALGTGGVPYMIPLSPFRAENAGDTLLRKSWLAGKQRVTMKSFEVDDSE
ncbi:MAG: spore germination protein [Eubacterium sp.]|nr:spore germination protein [Eubacterium sp.]